MQLLMFMLRATPVVVPAHAQNKRRLHHTTLPCGLLVPFLPQALSPSFHPSFRVSAARPPTLRFHVTSCYHDLSLTSFEPCEDVYYVACSILNTPPLNLFTHPSTSSERVQSERIVPLWLLYSFRRLPKPQ